MLSPKRSAALALAAICCALIAPLPASAALVTYTSDFADGNLDAPLPAAPLSLSNLPVPGFTLLPSGSNSLPAGDSVSFSGAAGFPPSLAGFFRGTSDPSSVPGFATLLQTSPLGSPTITISFDTVSPVTEIRLSVADLETATEYTFSTSTTAGAPSSVTSLLTLTGETVNGTDSTNGIQGEIVWNFVTPVVDPTIEFDLTSAFAFDESHFTSLSYTVAAVPEPMAVAWLAGAFGLVRVCRRPKHDDRV